MDDLRGVLEHLAQAVCDGLEKQLGDNVEIGLHGRWDDHEVNKRHLPLRAALVHLRHPLADCLVAVSSMREDVLETSITAATRAIVDKLGCDPSCIGAPEMFEYGEREVALEQLDALYSEPTLHFTTPNGELIIVVGSGLPPAVLNILRGQGGAPELAAGNEALQHQPDGSALPFQADTSGGGMATGEMVDLGDGTLVPSSEVVYTDAGPMRASDPGVAASAGTPPAPGGAAPGPSSSGTAAPAPATLPSFSDPYTETAAANAMSAAPDMAQLLSGVEVELSAELGRTNMRLGDITSLTRDSVFTLDQMVDEPVRVYVNGALFGTARLVVVEDEYGIEMLEVFDHGEVQTEHPLAA